jgi:preprotein translocase subunit SecG
MITFLTILYVFVCVFLILVVLLQAGRGGGMGAAFGGSSQSVFGGAGAGNFLTRLTVVMAALFMLLSATLAYLSTSSDKALEKASRAIKLREEARTLDKSKSKKAADGKAAPSTSEQSSAPASVPPEGQAADEGAMDAPAESGSAPRAAPVEPPGKSNDATPTPSSAPSGKPP